MLKIYIGKEVDLDLEPRRFAKICDITVKINSIIVYHREIKYKLATSYPHIFSSHFRYTFLFDLL